MVKSKGKGISFLVPFSCKDKASVRAKNWNWLKKYWTSHFPEAEIIMGVDPVSAAHPRTPFSKSCAVNDAASKATGDVFVIVDADGFLDAENVYRCVSKIRAARKKHRRLWYVPYRLFFRLTEKASQRLLKSPAENPIKIPPVPASGDILNMSGSRLGHWYGAVIQIMSKEAFEEVGGWDPRFRGWGGEDHAAMRAMDTLYSRHKTLPTAVLHIWHPMLSTKGESAWVDWQQRLWAGQKANDNNDQLSGRYYGAQGNKKRMRNLVEEGKKFGEVQ